MARERFLNVRLDDLIGCINDSSVNATSKRRSFILITIFFFLWRNSKFNCGITRAVSKRDINWYTKEFSYKYYSSIRVTAGLNDLSSNLCALRRMSCTPQLRVRVAARFLMSMIVGIYGSKRKILVRCIALWVSRCIHKDVSIFLRKIFVWCIVAGYNVMICMIKTSLSPNIIKRIWAYG